MFTDVVFLYERDSDDVFAVFPGITAVVGRTDLMTCYARVGQHSGTCFEYCYDCAEVINSAEYADLAAELIRIGYELCVVSKDSLGGAGYADERRLQLGLG